MWGEHGSRSGEKTILLFYCDVIGCHCSLRCCFNFKVEIKFRGDKIHVNCKSSQNSINQLVHMFVLQNKIHYSNRSNEGGTNITDVWQYSLTCGRRAWPPIELERALWIEIVFLSTTVFGLSEHLKACSHMTQPVSRVAQNHRALLHLLMFTAQRMCIASSFPLSYCMWGEHGSRCGEKGRLIIPLRCYWVSPLIKLSLSLQSWDKIRGT